MKRKFFALALAVLTLLSLAGCGKDKPSGDPSASAGELGLSQWSFDCATWSSPNGATITLNATPLSHSDSQSAFFVVRQEGETVDSALCSWNGKQYTASLDLNAADGYCYYVILTDGAQDAEIPVNTPTDPKDPALLDLAASLESRCEVAVEDSSFLNHTLTITAGSIQVQAPRITNAGKPITCTQVMLALTSNGEGIATAMVDLPQPDDSGLYTVSLEGVSFKVPASDDDQQLILEMYADLSNGQTLSATGSSWLCTGDEAVLLTVG